MADNEISREQIDESTGKQPLGPTMVSGRVASGQEGAARRYEEKSKRKMTDIPKRINELDKEKGRKAAKVIIDDDGRMNEETTVRMEESDKDDERQ